MSAAHTPGLVADSKVRSDFERWAVECGLSVSRTIDGLCCYADTATLWAWQAWQAGVARAAAPARAALAKAGAA